MKVKYFVDGLKYVWARTATFEVPIEERYALAIGIARGKRPVLNKDGKIAYYVTDLYDKKGNILHKDVPIGQLRQPTRTEIEQLFDSELYHPVNSRFYRERILG